MTATSIEHVNGHPVAERGFDAVALAEAEAIRTRAAAEAEAARIEAEGRAEAEKIKAAEEAERQRIANERAAMRLEKEKADHAAYLAKKAAEKTKADAEKQKAEQAAQEEAEREAQQQAEQERAERWWKWGARGIYAVGLIIAAPVQFMHFWDPKRPFLVAAPALLEGLALVLAFGAAWAVAHRRDVAPYRVGIMLGAAIAAAINLHGGLTNPHIGFNAGLIGAIASLGGPIVLMAYEHGIAQKADGIPSFRERRAAERARREEEAAKRKAREERKAAEEKAAREKAAAQTRAYEEQRRRDEDRKTHHRDVWDVADAMRSARGAEFVTEQIWADAWYRVTGCKTVGITPEIEARSRVAQARMKTAAELPIEGPLSLVDSQKGPRVKKDPDAPDGRRNNGGTPPVRRPGQTAPIHPLARVQARLEQKKD
ncbi:hypothetical protein ACIG0D_27325 [Streptomyces sp. NPDC052773]|uniref:hypothetical protein n=1 Tax=Streptomyces sp. NPDC052773 TaxID=3365693 RepID=UPI0037CF66B8